MWQNREAHAQWLVAKLGKQVCDWLVELGGMTSGQGGVTTSSIFTGYSYVKAAICTYNWATYTVESDVIDGF